MNFVNKKWNESSINCLFYYYSMAGPKKIARILGKTPQAIRAKASDLGINRDVKSKYPHLYYDGGWWAIYLYEGKINRFGPFKRDTEAYVYVKQWMGRCAWDSLMS